MQECTQVIVQYTVHIIHLFLHNIFCAANFSLMNRCSLSFRSNLNDSQIITGPLLASHCILKVVQCCMCCGHRFIEFELRPLSGLRFS